MRRKIMKPIVIPNTYNYIAVFLTLGCNLRCSFCINNYNTRAFSNIRNKMIDERQWITGLNRITSRSDLPITLQGGEPLIHPDFVGIINGIKTKSELNPGLEVDILTNLYDIIFVEKFFKVDPDRIKRDAPYASIRVSYHPEQMDINVLIRNVLALKEKGYYVGVWSVAHPDQMEKIEKAKKLFLSVGVDFRLKEFLGECNGHYRYKGACDKKFYKNVLCKTTELIVGPDGSVYRCTSDLYEGREPIGSILDTDFQIEDKFRECSNFGHCNPCDIKLKTDRFQQLGHSSVEIKGEGVEELSLEELKEVEKDLVEFNRSL
jgi:MoaA/NifB/PqqE/SkfB family radical SAM enzyme